MAWRVAVIAVVAILAILWRRSVGAPANVVQVQFGIAPEALTGAEMVIDGKVVGTLERHGGRTVSGFRVTEGDHTAELRLPGCSSEPARFTSGFGGRLVTLVWYPDTTVRGAESTCVLRLEH